MGIQPILLRLCSVEEVVDDVRWNYDILRSLSWMIERRQIGKETWVIMMQRQTGRRTLRRRPH